MDVSLEEIIRKKRSSQKGKPQSRPRANRTFQRNGGISKKPRLKFADARMKIIQNNRTKLVDARDKLAQIAKKTDARFKLEKLRRQNTRAPALMKHSQNIGNSRFTLSTNKSGQISLSSKKDLIHRPIRLQRSIRNDLMPSGLIHRTIVNDKTVPFSRMPPLPDIHPVWDSPILFRGAPATRKPDISIPRDLNMRITVKQNVPFSRHMSMDIDEDGDVNMQSPARMSYPPTKRPVRDLSPELERSSIMSRDYSPVYYEQRQRSRPQTIDLTDSIHSRLDVSPPPIRTMGILSSGEGRVRGNFNSMNRARNQQQQQLSALNTQGYRIVVSNLQSNVTQEDIKELFEDVGELMESRLVRPGTAEVIFKTLADAQKAVDVYHNRQLDGQPMKCLLVNPRLGNKPTAPALKPIGTHMRDGSTRKFSSLSSKSSVEPDIDAFHRVLFKKHRA